MRVIAIVESNEWHKRIFGRKKTSNIYSEVYKTLDFMN